jgi:hypothetical protein
MALLLFAGLGSKTGAEYRWLTPTILAIPKAEIRRIKLEAGCSKQRVQKTLSGKYPTPKKSWRCTHASKW